MSTQAASGTPVPWQLDRGRRAHEMGYLPGLDGIRALAVIGVLLYHADLDWIPGGYLGVDVFFVLSGFLITTLILEEFDRSGRVNFPRFYLGRVRRLVPPLALVLLVVSLAAVLVYRDAAHQVARDALASTFYVNNWWYVLAHQSYFEFIGRPPLLKHLWSLAVEEQFYLVWPAIAYLVVRRYRRTGLAITALALALASTAWMIAMSTANGYPVYADPSRAYFGTDSHAMGLLIGAALATAWRPGRLRSSIPRGAAGLITGIGLAALVAVVGFFLFVGEFTPWMYRGGFLVLAIVVALLVAAATHPASPLGSWLGTQPWRYIGQRSYGLYLWHWPIFMVTRPELDIPLSGLPLLILRLALTFAVAELSFRYLEMPIRRGAVDRWVARFKVATGEVRARMRLQAVLATVASAGAVAVLAAALVSVPSVAEAVPTDVAEAIGAQEEVSLTDASATPTPRSSGTTTTEAATASPTPTANPNGRLSAIGDSVMLGARSALKRAIPGTKVDAAVSRYPGAFLGPLKRYVKRDQLADVVVLHPGTNGVLPEDMMREMLGIVADVPKVVVLNDSMPRNWRAPNNAVIEKVVPEFPNAVLVDWYAASKDHPEYFVSDGVHLTPTGAKAYAKLIKQAAGL